MHHTWNVRSCLLSLTAAALCLVVFSVFLTPRGLLQYRICALPLQGSMLSDICSSSRSYSDDPNRPETSNSENQGHWEETLGIASSIHVISLARRTDRRRVLEQLMTALHLEWQYFDALDKDDALVDNILSFVTGQREKPSETFEWPVQKGIRPELSQLSELLFLFHNVVPSTNLTSDPLLCATGDDSIPTYTNASVIPFQMILSRGMIACWYSHVRLMEDIVKRTEHLNESSWDGREGVAIIFEDDIDVEWDIKKRLERMWPDLPHDWDIVMLGHCWSDESFSPALAPGSPLHPSHRPKCTHGYVLSPFGARRLLAHLTYAPFAYSRALDQAIAHLVQTRRIRSFSVVPSVVAQRRCPVDASAESCDFMTGRDSDIWVSEGRRGSRWRDTLEDSALERIAKMRGDR